MALSLNRTVNAVKGHHFITMFKYVAVNIDLSSIKKGELVDLYDQYVAPNDLKAGEFSSDDELGTPLKTKKKTSRSSRISERSAKSGKELTEENSFIVGEIKIKELNDEELIEYLIKFGIEVGPIVGKTKRFYRTLRQTVLCRFG